MYIIVGVLIFAIASIDWYQQVSPSSVQSCDPTSAEAVYDCLKEKLGNRSFILTDSSGQQLSSGLMNSHQHDKFQLSYLDGNRTVLCQINHSFSELIRFLILLLLVYLLCLNLISQFVIGKERDWINSTIILITITAVSWIIAHLGGWEVVSHLPSSRLIGMAPVLIAIFTFSLYFYTKPSSNIRGSQLLSYLSVAGLFGAGFSYTILQGRIPFILDGPIAYISIIWITRCLLAMVMISVSLLFVFYIQKSAWSLNKRLAAYIGSSIIVGLITAMNVSPVNGGMTALILAIVLLLIDMTVEERKLNFLRIMIWLLAINMLTTTSWFMVDAETTPTALQGFNYFSLGFLSSLLVVGILFGINSIAAPISGIGRIRIPKQLLVRHKLQLLLLGTMTFSFLAIGMITYLIESDQLRSSQDERYLWLSRLENLSSAQGVPGIMTDTFDINSSLELNAEQKILDYGIARHFKFNDNDLVQSPFVFTKLSENRVVRFGVEQANFHSWYSNSLLSKLLNIYTFLLITVVGLIILISDQITLPLSLLGQKLQAIDLGRDNGALDWKYDDEIGHLIQQYNNMLNQLEHSAENLAQNERDHAWKEMAKQVAHEIKNPLTPMRLNIQHLTMRAQGQSGELSEQVQRVAKTLIEQIDNLARIANEFSQFGQMPHASNDKILMNEVVTSVHDLFRKREDMEIQCFVPIDDLYIFADKDHLIRILNNVVKNAIQAIPLERQGKIVIRLYREDHNAVVSVSDNGCGIPDSQKSRVFQPNFTTKTSGTGLGLAMCSKMVESMNGHIYFETEVDEGSTFFIQIPLMRIDENYVTDSDRVELDA